MPNLVEVNYERTGRSTNTDALGMREMQARDAQHILIKAPPASGKSRALMFMALDKMQNQGAIAAGRGSWIRSGIAEGSRRLFFGSSG